MPSPGGRLMAGTQAVWGIDVGRCALKAVKLRVAADGKVEIVAHEYVEHAKILSQPDADRHALIGAALEKFLSHNDTSKDQIVVSVPGQHTLARFTKLPPVAAKRIPDIVRYEADQQIPFDMDEVIWDYQTFQQEGLPDLEVGIFAMKRELIREHLLHFEQAGIEPIGVQSGPLAVYNMAHFDGLLGKDVLGNKKGFNFDIRIQMGAGAYVCGEETSLISSCEGLRGDPKNRPPFPAQKGYLGCPSVVNNVETLCCVTKILEAGPATFSGFGSAGSSGTKLLSISGDCTTPGVYEVAFGIELGKVLKLAGAEDAIAVQVGGPSGQIVGPKDYGRTICFDDLATGGSIMTFGPKRDVLKTAQCFMEFFVEESCGYCTPCRVGNVLLKERLDRILAGFGETGDLQYLQDLGETVKAASRCGLGQTSPNPILTTLKNFRGHYEARVEKDTNGTQPMFDLQAAVAEAEAIGGRFSVDG